MCVSKCVFECMVLMHFVCECLCACPLQRAAGIYTADIQLTRACTQLSSRCLQYFISARHGWCPGWTQRAHSGVRTFTPRQPTSNPPNWPFPPALLCFIRGYHRRSSSFVPETCRLKINVDKDTGVKDKIMVWGGGELDSSGAKKKKNSLALNWRRRD